MSLKCRLSGHARRADIARMGDDARMRSECARCGKPMVRTWDKGWIVEKAAREAA